MTSNIILAIFAVYLLGVFLVGAIASKFYSGTEEGYFLSDRDLGPISVALSAGTSDSSGWIFIGAAGYAYAVGISTMWMLPGIIIGYLFTYIYLAPRLRRYTSHHGLITLPDVFEQRFNDSSHLLRLTSSVILLIFFTAYVGSQFTAAATAFEVLLETDFLTGLLIAGAFTALYTFFGGFKGVVWSDVVQGFVMAAVLVVFPIVMIFQMGGWGGFINEVGRTDPALLDAFGGEAGIAAVGFVIGLAGIGLGYPGLPHFLQRFIGSNSDETLESATVIGVVWVVIVMTGSNILGLIGRTVYPPGQLVNQEYVFPLLVMDTMHPIIAGIVLAAIMAAIMSSADSFLMMVSQTATRDIYRKTLEREPSQKTSMWVGRFAVLAIGILGLVVASLELEIVFWFVLYAFAGLGASFGPTLILSLYWENMTKWGAFAGMITGALTVIIWVNLPVVSQLYELVPGIVVSTLAIVLVSKATTVDQSTQQEVAISSD